MAKEIEKLCIVLCALCMMPCASAKAYDLKNITTVDGLSNSSVLSIMACGDGRVLLGTCDGLNAYDGNRAWKIPSFGEQHLSGSIILHCAEGRDEAIWVLTNHGLNKMRGLGREVILYPQFQGLRRFRMNPSKDIFLISGDRLYCSNGRGDSLQCVRVRDFPGGSIRDFEVTDRYLYLFTDQSVWRYDIRQGSDGYQVGPRVLVDKMPIVYASRDDDEEFLVTPDGLLRSYNLVTGESSSIISVKDEIGRRGRLNHVMRFKDALYASFETNGIVRLSLANGQYTNDEFAIKAGVTSMFKAPGGDILWIGTDGKGAYMLYDAPYFFHSYTYEDLWMSLSKPTRSVFLDHEHTLWMGTKGDGIVTMAGFNIHAGLSQMQKQTHRRDNSGMSSDLVYQFLPSSRQLLWIFGAEGADCYSYLTRTFSHVGSEIPLSHVIAAWEQADTLWMASLGGGVFKAEIAGTDEKPRLVNIRQYVLDGGRVSSNYFFGMAHDDKGRVWLANRGKGVYLIDNGQLRHVPFRKAYGNRAVYDVFAVLPVGRDLWIGTGAGIVIQRHDGREQLLDTEDYLPNNTIHALIADNAGNIYASTNAGIVCFLKGDIGNPIVWNDRRGVTEYSDGGATLVGDLLLFAGNNGLSCVKRNWEVPPQKTPPRIYFTDLHIQERHENILKYLSDEGGHPTLRLGHLQNSFSIGVSSLNYAEEADIVYSYRFSTKENWVGRHSNVISVTRLPWGHHRLYIKARNRLCGAEQVAPLDIYIVPPFYWSIWAKLLYLSLALSLLWLLFRLWWGREKARRKMEIRHLEQQQRDQMYEEKLNFLTNVVHELNTPLTLIYGPCERVLSYHSADGFVRKNVKQVVMNLSRLNYLIQEIIDFRRVTTGHHTITLRRVDVSSFLSDICLAYEDMASENHITMERNIAEGIVWISDERAFMRIANNLVSNAFKYTKQEGRIAVSLQVVDGLLCLSVYNTGKGIAPEEQDKIFDYYTVFEHVDESDNRGLTSRNGLGMAICHKMVKKLKGQIKVNSKVGEYAEFVVTLPMLALAEGAQQEIVRASSTFSADTPFGNQGENQGDRLENQGDRLLDPSLGHEPVPLIQRGDGSTILAIDDNADILKLLQESLEGYRVVTASSAEDGFAKLKDDLPDLIITDIMMPGIDGLDFTHSVKQNKHTMHIPMVILSAKTSEEERIQGLESGADVYISKPFSVKFLQATVNRLLESRGVLREYYNTSASAFTFASGQLMKNEDREFIADLTKLLDQNLKNSTLTPDDIAEMMCISSRTLYRRLQDLNLESPKEFIRNYRVEVAAKLLATTSMTVQEIFYQAGFNTSTQFYNSFQRKYGVKPTDYRKQHRVKEEML